ncbi:hypothetical protein CONPUDRAFT_154661 [Coniophora puteana RWD-64-598 SS2]|uniref:Uncharacterized protein n=1 Tax=Coniophora puteana (strain RWD-64-598) TaxID=741705 RepID=A0A5M3MNN1_CONPW|nr:uncharacterized protein CONPUDRAFT_154661 [Coniophora puteana RWD-64-598 SS2]EIW80647.1 hypothetical protein CONPUDRAFT_154661 [Coniophora puteana RWD-64-598 SS2]
MLNERHPITAVRFRVETSPLRSIERGKVGPRSKGAMERCRILDSSELVKSSTFKLSRQGIEVNIEIATARSAPKIRPTYTIPED